MCTFGTKILIEKSLCDPFEVRGLSNKHCLSTFFHWSQRRSLSYHILLFGQIWRPVTIFCYLSGKRYNYSRNALGSVVYQYLMGVPIEEYRNCFQKWIDRLKSVFRWIESILKGRATQNHFNICSKGETVRVTLFLDQPLYTF